ncbi:hypothetical protein PENTCL1PPCAC_30243, partial [Pristionchus entomophagus]
VLSLENSIRLLAQIYDVQSKSFSRTIAEQFCNEDDVEGACCNVQFEDDHSGLAIAELGICASSFTLSSPSISNCGERSRGMRFLSFLENSSTGQRSNHGAVISTSIGCSLTLSTSS